MRKFDINYAGVALTIWFLGAIVANLLWSTFHHRYDSPRSGWYHGFLRGWFRNHDPYFRMSFLADSPERWYWNRPATFSYEVMKIEWQTDAETGMSSEGKAELILTNFTYATTSSKGCLSREVVATWLNCSTNSPSDMSKVDAIMEHFKDAATGKLPGPRHHTYRTESPVYRSMQHFLIGFGVSEYVFAWSVLWLAGVCVQGKARRNER